MNLDDILEIATSLLTLIAIAMVALEKARPDHDESRKASLRRFLETSAFASPRRVQRSAARIVARALRGSRKVGSTLGFLGAPGMLLLGNRGGLQMLLVLALLVINIGWAVITGSLWVALILPAFGITVISVAICYPTLYVLLAPARMRQEGSPDWTFEHRGRAWVHLVTMPPGAGLFLTILSVLHPRVMRHEGSYAFHVRDRAIDIWPLAVGLFVLLTIPLAAIDGLAASSLPYRLVTIFGGLAFLVIPIVFVWLLILTIFQDLFVKQSPAQAAWSAPHILRAAGPTGFIAAAVSLTLVLLNPSLSTSGAGWFVTINLCADLVTATITGLCIRSVIRTRANTKASLAALGWVLILALVISGAKLYVSMMLSGAPLDLLDSYRIAWGLKLGQGDPLLGFGFFIAAQTATVYWIAYAILLLFMLSLSAFAAILRETFGLAVSTVSPLEILASYLTAVAAVAVLLRSLAKLFLP